jgi:hypothetical protein
VPTEFADHQRRAMLRAIHEREGRWDEVDPDTEVARIGNEIGLSEDKSYELFGISWTKPSSSRVVLIRQAARCRVAPLGSSDVKRT